MKTPLSYSIIVVFSVFFIGCENENTQTVTGMRDLLVSAVWGDESICGYIADPESGTRIFEQSSKYLEFSKIYQNLSGSTWSLKDKNTLIFFGDEYKISTLNENILEIRSGFCVSQYLGQQAGSKLTEGGYDLPDPVLYSDPLSLVEASNESGFSAKWNGKRTGESYFYTGRCNLWSRKENTSRDSFFVEIADGHSILITEDKKSGLPVRCLKD